MSEKRGRLSSLDLAPDEARPFINDAIAALSARRRTAESIREELNTHLLGLGAEPISRSAFNRYSLQVMAAAGVTIRAREALKPWMEKLTDLDEGNQALAISEMGKTLIYQIIEAAVRNDGELTPKELSAIALSAMRFEATRRLAVQTAAIKKDVFVEKANAAVDIAAKAAGLSAETAEAIKAKILGIANE